MLTHNMTRGLVHIIVTHVCGRFTHVCGRFTHVCGRCRRRSCLLVSEGAVSGSLAGRGYRTISIALLYVSGYILGLGYEQVHDCQGF